MRLDLGDGLVLRRGTAGDAERLPDFLADVFASRETGEPDRPAAAWARDLLEGRHPTFRPEDFTVVEEVGTGALVSCLNLIRQRWSYGGIPFGVGRVELVATAPTHRRRGLVRRQMDVVHGWCAEDGLPVQAISGIPWYYRQFGYEYALEMVGGFSTPRGLVPALKAGEAEPFRLRPATTDDLPLVIEAEEHGRGRYLVTALRDAALWRHEIDGRDPDSSERTVLEIVEAADGHAVGFVGRRPRVDRGFVRVTEIELRPGTAWPAVMPSILRALVAVEGVSEVSLTLDSGHPAYAALPDRRPRSVDSYSWYLRVPDLVGFVRLVAPVLERTLADSPAAGHSGELRLGFYRGGLEIGLREGRIADVRSWEPPDHQSADALLPELTFLQLLFGYKSFDALRDALPDCYARSATGAALVEGLFPPRPSHVWPFA
jgi:hypothetical protein